MEYILNEHKDLSDNCKRIKYKINGECWECTSHARVNGYPKIYRENKIYYMNRYIYSLYNGEIPENMVIRHKCDNRKCINPEHLEIGTQKDNMQDMVKRGRSNKGKKMPKEHGEKISKQLKGKPKSNEHKKSIAKTLEGNHNRSNIDEDTALKIKEKLLECTSEKWLQKYERIAQEVNISPKIIRYIKSGNHFTNTKFLNGGYKDWINI